MTIEWTKRARLELFQQLDFISLDKPSASERMGVIVDRTTSMLRDWPELGKPGKLAGTRELVIAKTPFVAVYSISGRRVRILRLLHGAQKYPG